MVGAKLGDFQFFHDKWNPWTELDSAMKTSYTGNPGEKGHLYTWTGNREVGSGEMEVVGWSGDTLLQRFNYEKGGDQKTYLIVKDNSGATDVTWGMNMNIGFFGRPIMLFVNVDKMLGGMYEKGLAKLKPALENMEPEGPGYEINEQDWPASEYIGKRQNGLAIQEIPDFLGKNFGSIYAHLGKNKIEPQSAPSAIYWTFDEAAGKTDLAAVVKVPARANAKGWENFSFPATKVLHVAYMGPYEKTGDAHMAIAKYMEEKGLSQQGVIEEYVTDPEKEKDQSKWLTNIYYILK